MAETIIVAVVLAIIVIAILYIISIWIYKRTPSNMGFIRTGFLGTKVCLGRGAVVLPVFHEINWVSLETIKLIISRSRDQGILTSDKIRIDVVAELYAHVGRTVEDVLTASRSLGDKTFDSDQVRNLLEAKVVSAIRSHAATKTLSELHENRDAFAQAIKGSVLESFRANGLTLEEVTLVTLEQTGKEYFKADNVFDAEGLKIITEITSDARRQVHDTEKRTTVSIRQKDLDTQLELLEIERQEAVARANQDREVSNEEALQLGQKQMYVLDQRKAVEEREINNELALERMRTEREVAITEEAQKREATEIQKALALENEQREKEIALIAKATEQEVAVIRGNVARESAEKDRAIELEMKERERHQTAEEVAIAKRQKTLEARLAELEVEKEEAFASARQEQEISNEQARVLSEKQRFILESRWAVQQEEIAKEISLINKELERERADIQRLQAREAEERAREIAYVKRTSELEAAEAERLKTTAEKEKAEKEVETVGFVAEAERAKEIERIEAEKIAEARRIDEDNKAQISRMHMISQANARKTSSEQEAEATLTRARATSEAQKISAEGVEREAAAQGRAEQEIESLRAANAQRLLEAEASGIEAKADALKKYNEAAMFLELARLQIEAERDVHIDQAKAMGTALHGAQIRMYGGGDGTMDTIRGMFTSGFAMGEVLEGVAQSLPEGIRDRLSESGIRGLFGPPQSARELRQAVEGLASLVQSTMADQSDRNVPLREALATLSAAAGDDSALTGALGVLRELDSQGVFGDVPFETVWSLLQALSQTDR